MRGFLVKNLGAVRYPGKSENTDVKKQQTKVLAEIQPF
jgi:hypothetical protein